MVTRDVFNALRRSGLNRDQSLDAITELTASNIVFGEIFTPQELAERASISEHLERLV